MRRVCRCARARVKRCWYSEKTLAFTLSRVRSYQNSADWRAEQLTPSLRTRVAVYTDTALGHVDDVRLGGFGKAFDLLVSVEYRRWKNKKF